MKSDRITSVDEFDQLLHHLSTEQDDNTPTIVIPAGTCGKASGADDLIAATQREILCRGLASKIRLRVTGCHGFCEMEPSVLVEPLDSFYPKIRAEDMPRIVNAAANGGRVEDLLLVNPDTGQRYEKQQDIPFFSRQSRLLLSRNQSIDPTSIKSYIKNGGYRALSAAFRRGEREWLIEQVKNSGLRGRGGAGFSTGRKWELLAKEKNSNGKYVVCNADEGNPGAYMDRSLLEGNPHSIIEGMAISGFAIGANEGVVYVRDEYPLAIKRLRLAVRQAHDLGLLGEDILGSGFSFDVRVVRGAGAFVCGEETSLIGSVEGKMGEPRQRPPYPVQMGIAGKPTMINNVETWANIPLILQMGAEVFAAIGTKDSSGTKIFSLVGKIKNSGLVEVPMGISIREVIYDIGGGPVGKAKIKAVQTGGPSGGCIPAEKFDLPIDYDSLASVGTSMGAGGMIVMDDSICMVDIAKNVMTFLKDESCGKCFTCRKGTQRMYELLDDISKGKATLEHLDLLEELALAIKDTTLCGLGQSAPNPVLSMLRYYRKEYERHIVQKTCDACVCKDLEWQKC